VTTNTCYYPRVLDERPKGLIFKRPDQSRFEIEVWGLEPETYEGLALLPSMVLTGFFELELGAGGGTPRLTNTKKRDDPKLPKYLGKVVWHHSHRLLNSSQNGPLGGLPRKSS